MNDSEEWCWVEISFADGTSGRLRPEALDQLPEIFAAEFALALAQVGEQMMANLRDLYLRVVHERPRNEGEAIQKVIQKGIEDYVVQHGDDIELGVFNLEAVRSGTHNEAYGTEDQPRSLFDILEEGYGPSDEYGWCGKDLAMNLAHVCLDEMHVPSNQHQAFLADVETNFAGRHGDGIMVKLAEPLFFRFPDFGTPMVHGIVPHAGWDGWHIMDGKASLPGRGGFNRLTGEVHWMVDAINQAMKKAVQKVQTI